MSSSTLAKDDSSPLSSSSSSVCPPSQSQSQSHPSQSLSHPSHLDRVQSPPNQPRRSLSTQLAPDYHNWVHDVSSSRPASSSSSSASAPTSNGPSSTTSSSTNRFLDAVTGRSKAQQGRARRENQPSFSGSAFTNSDREDNADDDRPDNTANHADPSPDQSTMQSPKETAHSSSAHAADQIPASKLPALDQSRVQAPDPNRPTYKLGAPIVPKPRPLQIPRSPQDLMDSERPTETSSLLGSQSSLRKPQEEEGVRWTNEGSRRGTARYNGVDDETDGIDDLTEEDSLRRPSR